MKKLILLLSIIALFCQSSFAQSGGLNFQGVARNASGAVLANQKINLKFSILKTTETGAVEYTEIKEATTNAQGIFAVVVGEVNATSFAAVDWKSTPKFLKVEMDAAGGTSFVAMGTTRLQNVPYAYYANGVNANNIDGTVPVNKGGTGATNASAALTNLGAESTANKSTDITLDANSLTKYPSVKTIKDYVDTRVITGVYSGTDMNITSVNGLQLGRGTGTNTNSVAVGKNALKFNTTGTSNTATGESTLFSNTTGGQNAGFGANTLPNNTTGGGNTAIGNEALYKNISGNYNSATGHSALWNNTTGNFNSAFGFRALFTNNTGSYNTVTGTNALLNNTIGSSNTAFGSGAGASLISGSNNVFLGSNSGNNSSFSNINNKLIIANSNTSSPLIYGDFFNKKLKFNAGVDSLVILNRINFVDENANDHINTYETKSDSPLIYSRYFYGHYGDLVIQGMSKTYTGNIHFVTGSDIPGYESPRQRMVIMDNGNIGIGDFANSAPTSKLQVSGIVSASGFKTPNGTSAQYLRADGTVTTSVTAGVPYSGASQATDLGAFDLKVNGLTVGIGSGSASTTTNTAVGNKALFNNSNGENNVSMGYNAMFTNSTGSRNVGVGNNALKMNTTGNQNVGLGFESLINNTTGSMNISIGGASMWGNTIGTGNAAIGNGSLLSNTTGSYNVALGYQPLWYNVLGDNNVAIGQSALFSNVNNSGSVAVGFQAMINADNRTSGRTTGNTAVGYQSLRGSATPANNTGLYNTAVGYQTILSNTSGTQNSALGYGVLINNTTGSYNTASGFVSLGQNTTGISNNAYGVNSLHDNISGNANLAVGSNSLFKNTTGDNNTAIGSEDVLRNNTTGSNNTALGFNSLNSNVGNDGTLAVGFKAMYFADNRTTGRTTGNTAIGYESIRGSMTPANNTGQNNTSTGYQSMFNNTAGNSNSAYGYQALWNNTTGDNNVAIGQNAMISNIGGSNNTALGAGALGQSTNPYNVTAIGKQSLEYNVAWNNTAVGHTSLRFTTTGGDNTALGFDAGLTNTTGNNNTFLGHQSDAASNNLTNATAIGKGAIVAASNTIQLGNNAVTNVKTSGAITAAGYKTPTGTSSQYLMADGSVSTGIASSTFTNKVIVGSATETSSSAILEVNSTSKGFLPPRMTNLERNAISNPVEGLMIWNTTENEINVFNGSLWVNMSGFTNQTVSVGMKYQGGIVAYVLDNPNPDQYSNPQNYLIISNTDLNPDLGIVWSPINAAFGSNNPNIGRASANTNIITSYFVNFQNGTSLKEYAAGLTRTYRGGGYRDWNLPSKDELNLVFQNRNLIGVFNLNSWYWSSTDDINYTAWAQNLFNGNQATKSYDTKYKVRAVRWLD
jgi:hypothetical protein